MPAKAGKAPAREPTFSDRLEGLLPAYLGRQRWHNGGPPKTATVLDHHEIVEGLQWLLVVADDSTYQVVVGTRPAGVPPAFLHGHDDALIGESDGLIYYDAVVDPSLALSLLGVVVPGEVADHVRPMGVEQSNTSLVYDDRVVLKLFRRVRPGANPDVEVTNALAKAGFAHVAAPLGVWRRGGHDLAVAQPFLAGAADGWAMALTSLRDLYATECDDPADCGGDFAGDAARLGDVTARMHLALAQAFATGPGDGDAWAAMAETQLERLQPGDADSDAARRFVARLRTAKHVGKAIRVHGDYHLGQVMQAEGTWYVLDFEGEPVRSMEERAAQSSPLKDVAGMLRSLHYAASVALSEQDPTRQADLASLAVSWEARNRRAFIDGYLAQAVGSDLLPTEPSSFEAVLGAFELDKAVYEVLYERGHRPDWVGIPQAAIRRLLSGT